jgi:hypothetical protein
MKAKDYAKQMNSEFEGVDTSVGSEGESQFISKCSKYVIDLIMEGSTILKERNVVKKESQFSVIKEQEQKWKSFYSNLSPSLKDVVQLDTFKTLFSHEFPELVSHIWPTQEDLKKAKDNKYRFPFKPF